MARRELTVERFDEIKRLLDLGRGVREITRSLRCSKETVRHIRDGEIRYAGERQPLRGPLWAETLDWDSIRHDIGLGYELKYIWQEQAQDRTGYPNFWKYVHRRYPDLRHPVVTPRSFQPGEYCEVDWAGFKVPWVELKTGRQREAPVFLGILAFSQLIFAEARASMSSPNFLSAHIHMYQAFHGVSAVTVPDNLKTGVTKSHRYDPDLNKDYSDLAGHYRTAIVPARVRRPKDKALIEGAVRLVMRYFRFRYRGRTFTSIGQINAALREVVDAINRRPHSRFKVSRLQRWEEIEKSHLKPLPQIPYEISEWRDCRLHPDSYIALEGSYYSAPHIHRGKILRVKLTDHAVEIFLNLERLALHRRDRNKSGKRMTIVEHLPPNSRAYYEATPQNILMQSRFLSAALFDLIRELFNEDALGHLRRTQGLVREARKEINAIGAEIAGRNIEKACQTMRLYDKIRVPYFRELLNGYRKRRYQIDADEGTVRRKPGNPMLRYADKPKLS